MSIKRRTSWWQLYVLVPFAIALLVIETRLPFSPGVHEVVEIGIVVLIFVLMVVWVQTHQAELIDEETEKATWTVLRDSDFEETEDADRLAADQVAEQQTYAHDLPARPTKGTYN